MTKGLSLPAELRFGDGDEEQRVATTFEVFPAKSSGYDTHVKAPAVTIRRPPQAGLSRWRTPPWTVARIYVLGTLVGTWSHPMIRPGDFLTIEPTEEKT